MHIGPSIKSLLVLLLIISFTISIYAQEVEDESEFDYAKGSKKGPGAWGKLHKEWSACNNGKLQSPIDLSSSRVEIVHKSKKLSRNYIPCTATLNNRGHDIAVHWEGNAGSIDINGTTYALKQAHWHSPSEHTINNKRYSLELHMVHKSIDPTSKHQIAVIGVLYKIGKPNLFLSKLVRNITSLVNQDNKHIHPGVIDPREIRMSCRRYYNYIGSLTVPPCTEGVIWTISKKVRTVSLDQVKLLREAVHDHAAKNARPLQPGRQRDIQLIGPKQN
ncbi:alpha carbonic anhydrase 4 [Artemisia annua]|uniref:Carbonic anhydrase n=1 Tax=Artemisia annua TaxID=35608 RepID=A0A2U1PGL5_ARTAN|nr:alpha carbonic anhydrase 4 [Artemisia annua]